MNMLAVNSPSAYAKCADSMSGNVLSRAAAEARGLALVGLGARTMLRGLGQALVDGLWVGRAFFRRQGEYRRLAELDERMLRDIGLTRGDVDLITSRSPVDQWMILQREMLADRPARRR